MITLVFLAQLWWIQNQFNQYPKHATTPSPVPTRTLTLPDDNLICIPTKEYDRLKQLERRYEPK